MQPIRTKAGDRLRLFRLRCGGTCAHHHNPDGGQTTDDSCRVVVVGYVYRSQQNGQVYDPRGLSPTICVGHHAGVEPRIIEYEDE